MVGLSIEGFEQEALALFAKLERREKGEFRRGRTPRKVPRELKKFKWGLSYEKSVKEYPSGLERKLHRHRGVSR